MSFFAKAILRGEKPVEEWADAQGSTAFPTTQQFLEGIPQEIVGQLIWQQRQGIHVRQQSCAIPHYGYNSYSVAFRALRSKKDQRKSAETNSSRESWKTTQNSEAAEPETPPQPPEPLPPQQSLSAQPSPLPSVDTFVEDEQEEVIVAERMVQRSIGRSEKYEVIGDGSVVVGVEKGMESDI